MENDATKDVPERTKKKAELICHGRIYVPDIIKLPYPLSSSTAGPGAGGRAIALSFGDARLKMGVTKDVEARFSLAIKGDSFQILKDGEVFIEEVEMIPTLLHAPNQAFVNLREDCMYRCEFCATPNLSEDKKKNKDVNQAVHMVLEAAQNRDFKSVAVTSGVAGSPKETVDDMIAVVKAVREKLGDVDIGVEPYLTDPGDITRLHDAGATEIKINIESFDREIFEKICPDLDYDRTMEMLKHAVEVFGKGKVATNILLGLGESDENVVVGIEHFAKMGVVPGLRMLRVNDYNQKRLAEALGHEPDPVAPERMIRLAAAQKHILEKHGLSTGTYKTMCHECGCCDIVPFKDI